MASIVMDICWMLMMLIFSNIITFFLRTYYRKITVGFHTKCIFY